MKLHVEHQESYSRLELLARSFFGFIYIALPHVVVLLFVNLWGAILSFLKFWTVLFTGRIPDYIYRFEIGFLNWTIRLNASLSNLVDGYPAIGVKPRGENAYIEFANPETVSRVDLLVRALFGFLYVSIPHQFVLFFRTFWGSILSVLAWWVVLFTGRYPESWHEFQVGTLRWASRVFLYLGLYENDYPPFSGKE